MPDERDEPTASKPLNGPRRPLVTPWIAVISLVLFVVAIVALLTWVRYDT